MRGTWQADDHASGKSILLIVLLVLLAGSGAAAQIATAVIVLVSVAVVLVVVAGAGLFVFLVRRARQERLISHARAVMMPPARELRPPERPAIEPPRPQIVNNFFGVTPDEVAEILRRQAEQ